MIRCRYIQHKPYRATLHSIPILRPFVFKNLHDILIISHSESLVSLKQIPFDVWCWNMTGRLLRLYVSGVRLCRPCRVYPRAIIAHMRDPGIIDIDRATFNQSLRKHHIKNIAQTIMINFIKCRSPSELQLTFFLNFYSIDSLHFSNYLLDIWQVYSWWQDLKILRSWVLQFIKWKPQIRLKLSHQYFGTVYYL